MSCIEIARLRLDRAMEHINEFDAETRDFFTRDSFGIEVNPYTEGGQDRVSYQFRMSQEIPQHLGIIAGECIHNLRVILDSIIWELAGKHCSPRHERIAFPVCKCPSQYRKTLATPTFKDINDFPPAAKTLIESLQPYNRGYADAPYKHPLSIIHNLWNDDKHRTPALTLAFVGSVDMNGCLGIPGSVSAGPSMAVKDGAIFAWGAKPEDRLKSDRMPKISVEIALDVRQPGSPAHCCYLPPLYNFVRDEVVAKFEPILS